MGCLKLTYDQTYSNKKVLNSDCVLEPKSAQMWLSVDPMSDKYPSMSPYNYCANNPVILVDPDGRDYETVIDEKKGTITIKAVYYTKNSNRDRLQNAIGEWNDQSGKYSVEMGEGENKMSYTVNFELTIAEGDFENDVDARNATPNDKKSNYFDINDALCEKQSANGVTIGANLHVKSDVSKRTDAHEIGHSLGIGDSAFGLMESGGKYSDIRSDHIGAILNRSGFSIPTFTPSHYGVRTNNKDYSTGIGSIKEAKK